MSPKLSLNLSLSLSNITDSVEAFKPGLQRPSPSSVHFSLSPVFLQISTLPLLSLFMCCFFLSSLCYRCSGVFFHFVSSKVFFTLPRTVTPAAESEHHHLSCDAACVDHRDDPSPVFAAARSWVYPVCLQPSLPHPSFNFCTSSCWRFVSLLWVRCNADIED